MGFAAVQRIGKGGNVSSISIGAGDGWATPTTGNLLVVTANSDATVTITGTWSSGPSVVDGNGTYVWYRISDGTETTITCTPSVSDRIAITACEYSGNAAVPFDVSNSSTIAGTSGTTTTSVSVTSTAAGDLIVAAACIHAFFGTAPSAPSWTNSFTNQLTATSGGTTNLDATTFYAELIAGAAGSYSTSASWTANASDRQELVIAFKAAAAAPAAAPPAAVRRGRTAVPVRSRPRRIAPAPAQVSPPFQPVHRTRQVLGRLRGRVGGFAPPQVIVPPPPYVPPTVHRLRQVLGRIHGRSVAPVPAQVVIPPPTYPVPPVHRLRQVMGRIRGHSATPVPAQVVVAPPAYPPAAVHRLRAVLGRVRGRTATPVPPQQAPVVARTQKRVAAQVRRPRMATPPLAQTLAPQPTSRPRRVLLAVKRRQATPVPPQVVIVPPAYPPQPVYKRLLAFVTRPGRRWRPVPPQVVVPATPGTLTPTTKSGQLGSTTRSGQMPSATSGAQGAASTTSAKLGNSTSGGRA